MGGEGQSEGVGMLIGRVQVERRGQAGLVWMSGQREEAEAMLQLTG